MKCPQCKSENTEMYTFMGARVVRCKDCKFDEGDDLELYPEDRGSQKAKSGYSPYQSGGGRRSVK